MTIDKPYAIIELSKADIARFRVDEKFQDKVFDIAQELSNETERTTCVYVSDDTWIPVNEYTEDAKFIEDVLAAIVEKK